MGFVRRSTARSRAIRAAVPRLGRGAVCGRTCPARAGTCPHVPQRVGARRRLHGAVVHLEQDAPGGSTENQKRNKKDPANTAAPPRRERWARTALAMCCSLAELRCRAAAT